MVRFGMSILIRSPFSTSPIAPPSAASGETWPIDRPDVPPEKRPSVIRSEEHTSELQSLMRISYAVFCLKKKKIEYATHYHRNAHKYNQLSIQTIRCQNFV